MKVEEYVTFNMPDGSPVRHFTDVLCLMMHCSAKSIGLSLVKASCARNCIRQAASSLGAAVYCINESVKYARERKPFGKALAENQAIQWAAAELATAEMLVKPF